MAATTFRLPISTAVLGLLGLVTVSVGILAMSGQLARVHPLLNGDGGLALLVSGLALLLSGAFPFALAVLASKREDLD